MIEDGKVYFRRNCRS